MPLPDDVVLVAEPEPVELEPELVPVLDEVVPELDPAGDEPAFVVFVVELLPDPEPLPEAAGLVLPELPPLVPVVLVEPVPDEPTLD